MTSTTPATVRSDTGARVAAARRASGLTVRQLAARIHVSAATITAIEHGRTSTTVDRLAALATALEVRPASLMGTGMADTLPQRTPPRDWRSFAPLTMDPSLSGAVRAFVATGYHGATIRSIAHAAGISPAAIYHHRAGKQELLVDVFALALPDLIWRLEAAAAQGRTPRQRLALVTEANALWHARRWEIAVIGASEMRSLEPVGYRKVALLRRRVQRLLDQCIVDALPDGTDPAVAASAGRAIATMCTSIPQWFKPEGDQSAEEVAREYARYAVRLVDVDGTVDR